MAQDSRNPQQAAQAVLPLEAEVSPLSTLLSKAFIPAVERVQAPEATPAKVEPPAPPREPMVPVKGDTFPIKEQIKALGGTWNGYEKQWYVPKSKEREVLQLLLSRVEAKRAALRARDARPTSAGQRAIEFYRQREAERRRQREAAEASRAPQEREVPRVEVRREVEIVRNPEARLGKWVEISICAICGVTTCEHPERRIIRVEV